MSCLARLALVFIVVPILEVVLLVRIGQAVGFLPTLAVVLGTGLVGAALARAEGFRILVQARGELMRGEIPGQALLDGISVLVAGALLACALLRRVRVRSQLVRNVLVALGILGLAGSVWLWHVATVGSPWMYPWGFLVAAACSSALITGALQGGVLGRALSVAPLLWLGRISYGVYLLHWPVFLWLTPQRVGWAPWPLFALRLAVTFVAAEAMFRLLERPVRVGGLLPRRQALLAAPFAVVALLVCTVLVTAGLPGPTSLQAAAAATASSPASSPASGAAPTTVVPAPPPLRVLVVGDEVAASAVGTFDVGGRTPMQVTVSGAPGCGLTLGGWVRLSNGAVERDTDRCGQVKQLWSAKVAAERPDVVVVWGGLRDVTDRRLGPEAPWRAPGDPELDDFLRSDVGGLVDSLGATGARVVLFSLPHVRNAQPPLPAPAVPVSADPVRAALEATERAQAMSGAPPAGYAENDDQRIDAWNSLLGSVAMSRGLPYIDVAAHMRSWPGGELDAERRPTGVGVGALGAADLAAWVAPQLRSLQPPPPPAPAAAAVAADAPLPDAPPVTPRTTDPRGRAANVLVAGDSVAYGYGYGLTTWAKGRTDLRATNGGQLGCPIARGGSFRFLRDIGTFEDRCDWAVLFPKFLREQDPTVVALSSGIWEVVDRRLPGDDRWRHIGQPEVDRYLLREFLSAIDELGSKGATVALLTYPHFTAGADQGYTDLPESDAARVDRLNALLNEAASLRPGVATVIDVQGWLAQQPGGEQDPAKREDGLHFRDAYAPTIAAWLGPQLIELAHNGLPPPPPAG